MKTAVFAMSAVAALAFCAPASAQIKTGIPPRAKSVIAAERVAKAEREQRTASNEAHSSSFDRLDANGDGFISPEEYRAAGAIQEAQDERRVRAR